MMRDTSKAVERPLPLFAIGVLSLSALAVAILILSMMRGVISVEPGAVLSILLHGEGERVASLLILDTRLPRFLVGALSGAALAASGVLLQGALRNDLADPGLLGVSSGCSLVVAVIVVMGLPVAPSLLPWLALAGGLVAGLVILLATRATRDPVRMILIGAALAALFSGAIVLVIVLGTAPQVQAIYGFLTGSLVGRGWDDVWRLAPWLGIGLPLALACIRPLNLIAIGEEMAQGLGLPLFRMRLLILLLAVGLVAPVVATCGPIGFIALVAPHLARAALKSGDHARVLPLSMLIGAVLLPAADLVAREALKPAELPVGLIVTALGAPVAVMLLRRAALRRAQA